MIKTKENTSCTRIQSNTMAKTCRIQHTKKNKNIKTWCQRWEHVVKVNEQCGAW